MECKDLGIFSMTHTISWNIFLISFNSSSSSARSERKEDKTASWFGMYGISSLSSSAILTHQFEEKIDHTKCVNMLHVCLHFFPKLVLNFIFSMFCLKGVSFLILLPFTFFHSMPSHRKSCNDNIIVLIIYNC